VVAFALLSPVSLCPSCCSQGGKGSLDSASSGGSSSGGSSSSSSSSSSAPASGGAAAAPGGEPAPAPPHYALSRTAALAQAFARRSVKPLILFVQAQQGL
jgi:hypothetical protein